MLYKYIMVRMCVCGKSSWLEIRRSSVRVPSIPDILTGSFQLRSGGPFIGDTPSPHYARNERPFRSDGGDTILSPSFPLCLRITKRLGVWFEQLKILEKNYKMN